MSEAYCHAQQNDPDEAIEHGTPTEFVTAKVAVEHRQTVAEWPWLQNQQEREHHQQGREESHGLFANMAQNQQCTGGKRKKQAEKRQSGGDHIVPCTNKFDTVGPECFNGQQYK